MNLIIDESEDSQKMENISEQSEELISIKGNQEKEKKTGKKKTSVKVGVSVFELISKASSLPPKKTIWNGIEEVSFGYVFGPPKSGKTILAENLAMSIASGANSFLGKPIAIKNRKILFVSLEEFWENRTRRNVKQIKKVCPDLDTCSWKENYIVVTEEFPSYLSTKADIAKLDALIEEVKPGIVFIDSLSRMGEGKIEDSEVAKHISRQLRELAAKYELALVCIHHCPKLSGQPLTTEALAGSRVIGQECDFAIGVNKLYTGIRYYKEVASRYEADSDGVVTPFSISKDCWIEIHDQRAEAGILGDLDGRRDDTNRNKVLEFMKSKITLEKPHISTKEIEDDLIPSVMSRATVFLAIENLKVQGKIKQVKKGVYQLSEGDSKTETESKAA